jgi:hypothetical protein
MLTRLKEALITIGFISAGGADHIMLALPAMLGCGEMVPRDPDILNGHWPGRSGWFAKRPRYDCGDARRGALVGVRFDRGKDNRTARGPGRRAPARGHAATIIRVSPRRSRSSGKTLRWSPSSSARRRSRPSLSCLIGWKTDRDDSPRGDT